MHLLIDLHLHNTVSEDFYLVSKDPKKGVMLILLLPCLFKIVPTDFSIPSGIKRGNQPAKMQPVEGAPNLGFAKFKAPGPPQTSVQQ